MATMIKETTCKCGNKYIDFGNQLGKCPMCCDLPNTVELTQQEILKKFTYMPVETALKTIIRLLAQEKLDKEAKVILVSRNPLANLPTPQQEASIPETRGLCAYIRKVFRRRK